MEEIVLFCFCMNFHSLILVATWWTLFAAITALVSLLPIYLFVQFSIHVRINSWVFILFLGLSSNAIIIYFVIQVVPI